MATLTGKQIADEGLHGWSFLLGGLPCRHSGGQPRGARGHRPRRSAGARHHVPRGRPAVGLRRPVTAGTGLRHPGPRVGSSEEVQPRIDAALTAGGTLVSDADAPSYWVLADPEGNRVCLCTWQERA